MKKIICILIFCVSLKSAAQTVKYKDVVLIIEGTSDEHKMDVLSAFLVKNLDHPAANLRIADLYIKKMQATDPLIEHEKQQALADRAQQKLFKAHLLINEKEVKKRLNYYKWVAKKQQVSEVSFALIKQELKSEKEKVDNVLNSLPAVYNAFTNSVDFYDKAVKNFTNISSSYPSLKNLYLLYDDKLDQQFSQLKLDYDSALFYFATYKSMTDTFALKGYNQSLKIKPINVFRYDGLVTQINFLKNDVNIWNYGAWVDTVRKVIERDIKELRDLLITNEQHQNKALEKIKTASNTKDIKPVKVDKSLVFNLLRFDYNNPVVSLLKYKEAKQRLLIEDGNSTYFDTAHIEIERKLQFYTKMIYQIKEADSIVAQFKNQFNAIRMAKYTSFLNDYYGGIDGSSQYIESEKNVLRKELAIYGQLLQEGVESIKPIDSIGKSVRYRKVNFPLQIVKLDNALLATGVPFTTAILKAPEGGYYIAGQHKPNKKLRNTKIYLIKLTASKRISWFKNYDVKLDSLTFDSNNYLASLTLTNEGVAFLIKSEHLTKPSTATTLFNILLDGSLKMAQRLNTRLYPRGLIYNQEQNSFIICTNGKNKKIEANVKNELELQTYNSLGKLNWTYTDSSIGAFTSLVKTERSYIIARNASTKNMNKARLTKVDFSGFKKQEKLLEISNAAIINRIYKLNDASIHLIGTKGYQMINAKLKKVYPY